MRPCPSTRLEQYLTESLAILQTNIDAYQRGCTPCYRVVAAQLRIILCDRKREHAGWTFQPLASRVFPDLRLHPVSSPDQEGQLPRIRTDVEPVELSRWLDQIIPLQGGQTKTLEECIKWVCEKDGGAHVDPGPDDKMKDQAAMRVLMVTLGDYLLQMIPAQR